MPSWKPVHFKDLSMAIALNASNVVKATLSQLAESYLLQIGVESVADRRVFKIAKLMLLAAKDQRNIDQEIESALSSLAEDRRHAILSLFARKFATAHRHQSLSVVDQANIPAPIETVPAEATPALPARGGTFDAPSRALLRSGLDAEEKLSIFLKIHKEIQNLPPGEVMVEKCRVFFITTVKPIFGCFSFHCNSDPKQFLSKWSPFRHAKFGSKCCKGKSGACGRQ